jgi:hypothetical protein
MLKKHTVVTTMIENLNDEQFTYAVHIAIRSGFVITESLTRDSVMDFFNNNMELLSGRAIRVNVEAVGLHQSASYLDWAAEGDLVDPELLYTGKKVFHTDIVGFTENGAPLRLELYHKYE